jgi:hypothetical protein
MLSPLMEELSKELRMDPPLRPDDDGKYTLFFQPEITVDIADYQTGFSLYCIIGSIPEANVEAFYTRVLLGNLFGQGTTGAVLGLNDDGKLTVSREVPYAIEYKGFRDILEDFLNTIEFWQDEIKIPVPGT